MHGGETYIGREVCPSALEAWTYDPELQEAGAMAMLGTAAICSGEGEVRTLVLVEL